MSGQCTERNCFPDIPCVLGEPDRRKCRHWQAAGDVPEGNQADAARNDLPVPWHGDIFGQGDLIHVAARGRPLVIGILGAHDAGKTTFLVILYLQLLRGERTAGHRFAGSYTLGAWDDLTSWMRWDKAGVSPTFPPHTSSRSTRQPGLLHLALRSSDGRLRDLLLTDAPGEWFKCWSNKEDDPDAEGARWVARNADAFLIFADSARLSGATLGQTRRALRELLGRAGPHAQGRPSMLLWSKSDHSVSETVHQAIETMSKQAIPEVVQESITYQQPETMIAAFSRLVEQMLSTNGRKSASILLPVLAEEPFFAIRGSR